MGFYDRVIMPRLLNFAMAQPDFEPLRQDVAGAATGKVLEFGIGPGLNLSHYGAEVSSITGIDPSAALLKFATERAAACAKPVELLQGSSEAMRFDSASFDTVVTTWTLCSIPNAPAALREARRVLKPGGQLLFIEHGRSPEPSVQRWQDRVTPIWKHATGGCHLNRDIALLIRDAGFGVSRLRNFQMRGPRMMTYMYEGAAQPL